VHMRGSISPLAWALLLGRSQGEAVDFWKVETASDCNGVQTEVGPCPDLPECQECIPINCVFNEWEDWGACESHCTGLRERHRATKRANNECGNPCFGNLTETDNNPLICPRDCAKIRDCVLSDWTIWDTAECSVNSHAQQKRDRDVMTPAENGGKACTGSMVETKPCSLPEDQVDCEVSMWGGWTSCSKTCDLGYKSRTRRVTAEASNDGKPCTKVLEQLTQCTMAPCSSGVVDCVLGEWGPWDGCNPSSPLQRQHERKVLTPASGGGVGCKGGLSEYAPCPQVAEVQTDCVLSDWGVWKACDQTCGGGQQYRSRTISGKPKNGGTCPSANLKETQACATQPCEVRSNIDCVFGTWADWSVCSVECGIGQMSRSRIIANDMKEGGKGCLGPINEIEKCQIKECDKIDCVWGDWHEWSACTCSCNGGTKTRNRHVVTAPLNGGRLCEQRNRTEIAPCNQSPCDSCEPQNGTWRAWTEWSECSASCDDGFKKRQRVATRPSECGMPAEGGAQEFEVCTLRSCEVDSECLFEEWVAWSACSCPCYGVMERTRTIRSYATGNGKACDGNTKEIIPCNPGVLQVGDDWKFLTPPKDCQVIEPPVDCVLSQWTAWTQCTQTCGGGQTSRHRDVITPDKHGGKPCVEEGVEFLSLSKSEPCHVEECERDCEDCQWGAWTPWSECTYCGGEKRRTRMIQKQANYCGRPCNLAAASEVAACHSGCDDVTVMHCGWSVWEDWGECSASCGSATQNRARRLVLSATEGPDDLFVGDQNSHCAGVQSEMNTCPHVECPNDCMPKDCLFGEWSEWQVASCDGLCPRSRVQIQMSTCCHGGECGKPCAGPVIDTKECPVSCDDPVDCLWSEWSDWTVCENFQDQRKSTRTIKKYPENNGTACVGAAEKTEQCDVRTPPPIVDCLLSQWNEWSECTVTCAGGTQERTRLISRQALNGGAPCTESLAEIQGCHLEPCNQPAADVNCAVGDWSEWAACDADGQQTRKKSIVTAAAGHGTPCTEELSETQPCKVVILDCEMSQWTEWNTCDKTCDGGQTVRFRQVNTQPTVGGDACPTTLKETAPCAEVPCGGHSDCELSDWTAFTACSVSCGVGQQTRTRSVLHVASGNGRGCVGHMSETSACPVQPDCGEHVDCVWGQWGPWSDCTCECDGGMKRRDRSILTAPTGRGKLCDPIAKQEISPCNTQPCSKCVDGLWSAWNPWTSCTSTCDGGTMRRSRNVIRDANVCGKPVTGPLAEIVRCNTDISCDSPRDCVFADWDDWSSCSCTCDGVKHRTRSILTQGRSTGAFCNGDTQQTVQCNPAMGLPAPRGCRKTKEVVDCKLNDWEEWQPCSVSCGRGQQSRKRSVAVEAKGGGDPCDGNLSEIQPCHPQECAGPEVIDCAWSAWSSWSGCSKCSGQKNRHRTIVTEAKNGGLPCADGPAAETTGCDTRACHAPSYCSWSVWAPWSSCSAKCGAGRRSRERKLTPSQEAPAMQQLFEHYVRENAELQQRSDSVEGSRVQEIAISFSAGAISLVVFFGALRTFQSTARSAGTMFAGRSVPRYTLFAPNEEIAHSLVVE